MPFKHLYQSVLQNNRYPRQLKTAHPTLTNFSASDYLALSKHPLLVERSQHYAKIYGVGATASRLVTGNLPVYAALENTIAQGIGKESALIIGSGYQTNCSVLEALLDPAVFAQPPIVFCDRYIHASMLAGVQHRARLVRFHHNDMAHLQQLFAKHAADSAPKFLLVESIYSMDGDEAPLPEIIALAKKYNAFLYVDDAHAVGIYGHNGWGKASLFAKDIDLVMGTFSKALGSYGGYVACSQLLRDYLINKCRGFIYATALSPAVLGAIDAAVELLPQLTAERHALLEKAARLRHFIQQEGLDCGYSSSHIVPWIIGDANQTLQLAAALEAAGILAVSIRPPSVPPGLSRIRFCLSTAHTEADMTALMAAITQVKHGLPLVI